jgi:hypothetical protein
MLRNYIEHTDDKLRKNQIKAGDAFILNPKTRAVAFGSATMSYRSLAACITKCYQQIEAIRGPSQ